MLVQNLHLYYSLLLLYLYDFLNNSDFNSQLLIAINEGEVIAGAIFTFTKFIMQYHLAGTKEDFITEAPMKLIIDEARLIGNVTSAKSFHLGGGVGGQDTDSLFRFKSAFSKDFKQFSVWKFIVNEEIYHDLSKDKVRTDFFPLYRS
jgi:lipid II:glycine glycyltransferase (peptidoglycan interpeptide bridge formation enzyme)